MSMISRLRQWGGVGLKVAFVPKEMCVRVIREFGNGGVLILNDDSWAL